jgi:uncharacterized protein YbjT (DUF2867 family)
MIMVAGPTNELGWEICYFLASQGKSIRALVLDTSDLTWVDRLKNFGATLAVGDLYDPIFIADAFVGVHEVICSSLALAFDQSGETRFRNIDLTGVMALIDAAKEADVLRFVYLSLSGSAGESRLSGKAKQRIEQRLVESGVPYTILHAGDFYAQPQPESRMALKDLARLATDALDNPGLRNAVVELVMPAIPAGNIKRTVAVGAGKEIGAKI